MTLLYRKCYKDLLDWKNRSKGSTAILLEGARRSGKTTLAKEFADKEYVSSLYIDFSHVDTQVLKIFNEYRHDTNTLLRMLQIFMVSSSKSIKALLYLTRYNDFPPQEKKSSI